MRRSSVAAWALVAVFAASANLLSGFSCGGGNPNGGPGGDQSGGNGPCCTPLPPTPTPTPTPTPGPSIDEVEPNDAPGNATALGPWSDDPTFIGSCSPEDPVDYYASTIPAGGAFQVSVNWDVPNWDLDVLVTGTGYELADTEGASPALVSGLATTGGTAFIRIACAGAGAGTNYSGSVVEP